ncbi:DUF5374 domain-containing protein [Haemophilus paraphrohaemolyticus]|jgi:hypothetical protein|uniref:Prepilin-type cleavage/methylation N-terminal domain protein n=1 Tax=Haemophilus paraphrohaemolyticus HK411 TaxID=1095743 RepID=I2NF54_9PAST|nr:DUF5374 domain-containing protein [Haemophilus paraphrohaemolyticus]EIG24465.1 hypothetical protein HMPREF1054_0548 [Haemophilus paraphrohaemolyticus HK411]OOR95955.1 hypothetical protein B0184_03015 [Haemophilus paraphrohaemolyticus]STP00410.1 Uncharacterised protein [Haemophilus paraphrohaemolyticus]
MVKQLRAESLVSLLVALTLFAIFALNFTAWQKTQLERGARNYQQQQALQIAENQIALRMAGLSCEPQAVENDVKFIIQCSGELIKVSYPMGHVEIKVK